ncbi:ribosomal protein S6 [Epithele typhae]|uniref:ribosomal protein S6 n=1 Tax=Epithele typhae TaxID=378194 RepID=UPI002008C8BC|nr:ribosomal protein S6 [Epithele typhae]KAH9929614.1 ribosomal protein S6 [Epithele typhae]
MPLYQLTCIAAHYPEYRFIKELVTRLATHVMDNGGVVRKIDSWGTRTLPQRMKKLRHVHTIGDYWTMQFDASPSTIRSLSRLMHDDPRVIRGTNIKLGEQVKDIRTFSDLTTTRP